MNATHAKIDGWLRFLITRRPQDAPETVHFEKVREKLSNQKQAAEKAQDELLQLLGKRNNRQDEQKVVEVWGNCRMLYTSYHAGVKAQFDKIRTLVAEEWTTMKRQEPRARKSAGA